MNLFKSEIYSVQPHAQMFRVLHHPLEFFTTSNSTRSKSKLLHSAYVGIKYLLFKHSSESQSPKIIINCKILIVIIPKNCILHLLCLADLLTVKTRIIFLATTLVCTFVLTL